MSLRRRRRGQSSLEYMLYVSVIAIALVAAGWALSATFGLGVNQMLTDATDLMQGGTERGRGDMR